MPEAALVMPSSLQRLYCYGDSSQFRTRHGHFPALPSDLNEHVVLTVIFRRHANHFDGFAFPER